MNQEEHNKEVNINLKELTQLFEGKRLRDLRYEFFEKVALLIIAALGLISALAWEEAFKTTFKILFEETGFFGERFLYPIIITVVAVILSILISRFFLRRTHQVKDK